MYKTSYRTHPILLEPVPVPERVNIDAIRASEFESNVEENNVPVLNPKIKTKTNTIFLTLLTSFTENLEKPSRAQ